MSIKLFGLVVLLVATIHCDNIRSSRVEVARKALENKKDECMVKGEGGCVEEIRAYRDFLVNIYGTRVMR